MKIKYHKEMIKLLLRFIKLFKAVMIMTCFVSIISFIASCSAKQPDLKMNEVSINSIEEIEKLNDYMFADYDNLIQSCKKHTDCWKYNNDKCYLPANSALLHKYLKNPTSKKHVDYLTDNKILTGNIDIRHDSTVRFEVKFDQNVIGGFGKYQDTVFCHEIVYHISKNTVYDTEIIIVKIKQIKPNWYYYITKQGIE